MDSSKKSPAITSEEVAQEIQGRVETKDSVCTRSNLNNISIEDSPKPKEITTTEAIVRGKFLLIRSRPSECLCLFIAGSKRSKETIENMVTMSPSNVIACGKEFVIEWLNAGEQALKNEQRVLEKQFKRMNQFIDEQQRQLTAKYPGAK